MKKVMVGMSGGVDSSVAAFLLKQQGYDVVGATFKLFDQQELGLKSQSTCCSIDDVTDAKFVCNEIGIPHYVLNYKELFKEKVVDHFADSYLLGKTPNPCIECNRHIKFDAFLKKAIEMGFDYIATGHYSAIDKDEKTGRYLLKKAKDSQKDQSYALYYQTQKGLERTLMPLSEYTKDEVRMIAKKNNLIVYKKPDSQDICFIPDGDYGEFLKRYRNISIGKGNFTDINKNVLGQHSGYYNYTIGQRRGLGMGFLEKKYVIDIDAKTNTVVLGATSDLLKEKLTATDLNWVALEKIEHPLECMVKFRYSQKEIESTVIPFENGKKVEVVFNTPQKRIASGQAVVFYSGDIVLGGGTVI